MISYYKQLKLMEEMGKILGYKVKVRTEGFDMLWIKGDKTYSFNFGIEGKETQMVILALDKGYEHIQIVLNDKNDSIVKGLPGLFTHKIDLRQDFSLRELMLMVIQKDRAIRSNVITKRIYQITGKKSGQAILKRALDLGLVERIEMSSKVVFYKLIL